MKQYFPNQNRSLRQILKSSLWFGETVRWQNDLAPMELLTVLKMP
jgi:hypothetical protein